MVSEYETPELISTELPKPYLKGNENKTFVDTERGDDNDNDGTWQSELLNKNINPYGSECRPKDCLRRSTRTRCRFDPNFMPSGTLEMEKLHQQIESDSLSDESEELESSANGNGHTSGTINEMVAVGNENGGDIATENIVNEKDGTNMDNGDLEMMEDVTSENGMINVENYDPIMTESIVNESRQIESDNDISIDVTSFGACMALASNEISLPKSWRQALYVPEWENAMRRDRGIRKQECIGIGPASRKCQHITWSMEFPRQKERRRGHSKVQGKVVCGRFERGIHSPT